MAEPRTTVIEGRKTLVVPTSSNLPKSMPDLLGAMGKFGFTFRDDFTLKGTRTACEQLQDHRMRRFREGRWWNVSDFTIVLGQGFDAFGKPEIKTTVVRHGVRELRLEMCEDCGTVAVHDVTPTGYAGARPAVLVNNETGEKRIAPAIGRPDIIIGRYSGKRRNARTYQ